MSKFICEPKRRGLAYEQDKDTEFTSKSLNIYKYLQYFVATLIVIAALWFEHSSSMRAWINSNINHQPYFMQERHFPELSLYQKN